MPAIYKQKESKTRSVPALLCVIALSSFTCNAQIVADNNQIWTQIFDSAFATGLFNDDPYPDLAIGAINEFNSGRVRILYGTSSGPSETNMQEWHTDTGGGLVGESAGFGYALASGDFDGNGTDDLAIGAPYENGEPFILQQGAVYVLYSDASGLAGTNSQRWDFAGLGSSGSEFPEDRLGWSVVAGNFNGDTYDDLAMGAPGQSSSVYVLFGSATGLSSNNILHLAPGLHGIPDPGSSLLRFGWALGAGDFNNDSIDDLAIGEPWLPVDGNSQAGAVHVLYGSETGPSAVGVQLWHQNVSSINDICEQGDNFGSTLESGDFNNDGYHDLAIGVPKEDIDGVAAGAVEIIYGTADGLFAANDQLWSMNSANFPSAPRADDQFGYALSAGDFSGDGFDDLAISVPWDDLTISSTDYFASGTVYITYGSENGLSTTGVQYWHQDSTDILDMVEDDDLFGYAMVTADFDTDGADDLVIGASGEGAAHLLFGSRFNSEPLATNDNYTILEDTILMASDADGTSTASADDDGLLVNDSDPEGDTLAIASNLDPFPSTSATLGGTVDVDLDGTFVYVPPENQFGTTDFSYEVTDGEFISLALVTIQVMSVNDPPSFEPGPNITIGPNSGPYSTAWASNISAGPENESGQSLVFQLQITASPSLVFDVAPTISESGILTFTTTAGATGTADVDVTLMDDAAENNSSPTVSFQITVQDDVFASSFEL